MVDLDPLIARVAVLRTESRNTRALAKAASVKAQEADEKLEEADSALREAVQRNIEELTPPPGEA